LDSVSPMGRPHAVFDDVESNMKKKTSLYIPEGGGRNEAGSKDGAKKG